MQNCHIMHDYLITQIEVSQTLYIPEIVSESFWVVISLEKIKGLIWVKSLSCVQLFVIPQTVAHQAPLSMGFSRQEYQNGLPSSTPGDLPDPGIKPVSLASPALAGRFFITVPPGKAQPCAQ